MARPAPKCYQQVTPYSYFGVPAPAGMSDWYENRGFPAVARCTLSPLGPVDPLFYVAVAATTVVIPAKAGTQRGGGRQDHRQPLGDNGC